MKPDPVLSNVRPTCPESLIPQTINAISAEFLFGGAKEILIRHLGENYRLRITRHDKLILTK